jgi:glycosyltransferase involved in cell wall biosynthesis
MKKSNFTVLMSVYIKDDPLLFEKALDSVFNNSSLPFRVLLVVDGPLTSSLDRVLDKFSNEPNLLVHRLELNMGLSSALNEGLKLINTEFTVRADSDDINNPNRFAVLISLLESGYDLVGSAIIEVDKSGSELAVRMPPLSKNEIKKFAKKRSPFNHMSVAFRTQIVIDAGGYPNIYLKEDYALWSTLIARNIRMCNSDQILVRATTGQDFYKRRGGIRYAFAEIAMQKHLISSGLKNPASALIDGILRAAIFLAPAKIREFVYLNFLRRSLSDK